MRTWCGVWIIYCALVLLQWRWESLVLGIGSLFFLLLTRFFVSNIDIYMKFLNIIYLLVHVNIIVTIVLCSFFLNITIVFGKFNNKKPNKTFTRLQTNRTWVDSPGSVTLSHLWWTFFSHQYMTIKSVYMLVYTIYIQYKCFLFLVKYYTKLVTKKRQLIFKCNSGFYDLRPVKNFGKYKFYLLLLIARKTIKYRQLW